MINNKAEIGEVASSTNFITPSTVYSLCWRRRYLVGKLHLCN